jgi:hypothetical protein
MTGAGDLLCAVNENRFLNGLFGARIVDVPDSPTASQFPRRGPRKLRAESPRRPTFYSSPIESPMDRQALSGNPENGSSNATERCIVSSSILFGLDATAPPYPTQPLSAKKPPKKSKTLILQ